jgi:hydrogenase expression/formation protein HypC
MCLGIPGRIVDLPADRPEIARVEVDGRLREVNVMLLEDAAPQPGDWVLIHLGFALQTMTEDEASETLALLAAPP